MHDMYSFNVMAVVNSRDGKSEYAFTYEICTHSIFQYEIIYPAC